METLGWDISDLGDVVINSGAAIGAGIGGIFTGVATGGLGAPAGAGIGAAGGGLFTSLMHSLGLGVTGQKSVASAAGSGATPPVSTMPTWVAPAAIAGVAALLFLKFK